MRNITKQVIALAALAHLSGIAVAEGYRVGDRLQPGGEQAKDGYVETKWESLVPTDWHPEKVFQGMNFSMLDDADPRTTQALERLHKEWESAPPNKALNGAHIRIAGFLVPLERARDEIREFLLVPYFGACIHAPPPPANQIIHVFPVKPVKDGPGMAAVWVSGVLETTRSDTGLGAASYQLRGEIVTAYKAPRPKPVKERSIWR